MIAQNTAGIIKEICEAMAGDECSQWQVGVTPDPEQLLKILRIPTDPECFVCFRAANPAEARAIAAAFWNIQSGKSSRSVDDSDKSAVYVFAWRTQPCLKGANSRRRISSPPVPQATDL
jgi:hypothetical protein